MNAITPASLSPSLSKTCSRCGTLKPLSAFDKSYSVCKVCRSETRRDNWAQMNQSEKLVYWARGRAREKDIPFDLAPEDVVIPNFCPVLGTPMERPSLDRHDPERGYVKGNVVVISHRANQLKSNASPQEAELIWKYLTRK